MMDFLTHRNMIFGRILVGIFVINSVVDKAWSLELEESVTINKPTNKHSQIWTRFPTENVTCFCNLPVCVTSGYMCKSLEGACFSELSGPDGSPSPPSGSSYKGRHGCLELLNDANQRRLCLLSNSQKPRISPKKNNTSKSLLHCCYRDMCNHADSPQTKILINNTLLDDIEHRPDIMRQKEPISAGYSNSEVWFRAATIAVPICGAVILFVLIALAVKILRTERMGSPRHKLGSAMYVQQYPHNKSCEKYPFDQNYAPLRRHCPLENPIYRPMTEEIQRQVQVPLLVQNEVLPPPSSQNNDKNETNAKLNLIHSDNLQNFVDSGKSIIIELEKTNTPQCSQSNVQKNLNTDDVYLSVKCGEKLYVKSGPKI